MKKYTTKPKVFDLHDYDSPIKRSDGVVPYNSYIWPMHGDCWFISHERQHHAFPGQWRFNVVGLDNGKWSVCGQTWKILHNDENSLDRHEPDHVPVPVVFDTRAQAIRVAAARMIRQARRVSKDTAAGIWDRLPPKKLETLINWALEIVAKECGKPSPKPVRIAEPPKEPVKTGLDLFDARGVVFYQPEAAL